jgi:hypothetical protein
MTDPEAATAREAAREWIDADAETMRFRSRLDTIASLAALIESREQAARAGARRQALIDMGSVPELVAEVVEADAAWGSGPRTMKDTSDWANYWFPRIRHAAVGVSRALAAAPVQPEAAATTGGGMSLTRERALAIAVAIRNTMGNDSLSDAADIIGEAVAEAIAEATVERDGLAHALEMSRSTVTAWIERHCAAVAERDALRAAADKMAEALDQAISSGRLILGSGIEGACVDALAAYRAASSAPAEPPR